MDVFQNLANNLKGKNRTIVFPEGTDPRIMGAAVRLHNDGLLQPVLLGDKDQLSTVAEQNHLSLNGIEIINHELVSNTYSQTSQSFRT